MKTRDSFKDYLNYHWWAYLVIAIILVLMWVYVFGAVNATPQNEKITVFVSGTVDYADMEPKLTKYLNENAAQPIENAYFDCLYTPADDMNYEFILATKCQGDADIIILPESRLKSDTCESFVFPVGEDELKKRLGENVTIYYENGVGYGVLIASTQTDMKNNFTVGLGTPSENYYAFFSAYSVNLDKINTYGNVGDDAGFKAAEWLLKANNG